MACNGDCKNCGSYNYSDTLYSILPRRTVVEYKQEFGKPTSAVINVTNECTHRCRMCFVDFAPKHMSIEIASKVIDFIKRNAKEKNTRGAICFFGGEPLLRYKELIVPVIEKYGDEVDWSITTNGLLLDEDKVDFFRMNNVQILFSFDGDKKTQDFQRPLKNGEGSFDKNVKNIPYYVLRYPQSEMRATITKESIPYMYDNFLFAEKMCFSAIDMVMDSRPDIEYTDEEARMVEDQINKIVSHILRNLILGTDKVIRFNNFITIYKNIERQSLSPTFNNEIFRCGTGVTSIGISPDGRIFPCQERSSFDDGDIGDIFNGIDEKKHLEHIKLFLSSTEEIAKNMKANALNLSITDPFCPNRYFQGNQLGQGHIIMSTAMFKAVRRIQMNFSNSPIERVNKYLYGGR